MAPKILVFDLETKPNLGYFWRIWQENIGIKQILEASQIMSWCAKWLGEKEIFYEDSRKEDDDKRLLKNLIKLLDEADFVIAHNGVRFDMKQLRGRALVQGYKPFSPVKVIDTFLIARREFGLVSNKLEYLADILGCAPKDGHKEYPGFELWRECLKGNEHAWDVMEEYNKQDVLTLEQVYLAIRPYDTQHANLGVYEEAAESPVCPKCGSIHLQRRGFAYTNVAKYQRYQCGDCGGWSRSRYQEDARGHNLLANVAN